MADPAQRAALLLLRWSGARRDEIRRLTCDSLDTDAQGNPRLRIPVGKGHAERIVRLHPDAAEALRGAVETARARNAIRRYDPHVGRPVDYVFIRRGKLISAGTLFDEAFQIVCTATGLVNTDGINTVSTHRFRHTLGTQLRLLLHCGARCQRWVGRQLWRIFGWRARVR